MTFVENKLEQEIAQPFITKGGERGTEDSARPDQETEIDAENQSTNVSHLPRDNRQFSQGRTKRTVNYTLGTRSLTRLVTYSQLPRRESLILSLLFSNLNDIDTPLSS